MRFSHTLSLGAFLLTLLIVIGCDGNNHADVTGTAKFEGVAIEKGSITFIPVDPTAAGTAGGEIINGNYSVKVPPGKMKVAISWSKVVGKKKLYDAPDSPERPIYEQVLPPKYSDINATELTLDVQPGKNEMDWNLRK